MPEGDPLGYLTGGAKAGPSPQSMATAPPGGGPQRGQPDPQTRNVMKRKLQSALQQLRAAAASAGIPWDEVASAAGEGPAGMGPPGMGPGSGEGGPPPPLGPVS